MSAADSPNPLLAAATSAERPIIARLRDRLTDIDAAQKAGVKLPTIHRILAAEGLDMPIATLRTSLHRLRKSKRTAFENAQTQPSLAPSEPSKTDHDISGPKTPKLTVTDARTRRDQSDKYFKPNYISADLQAVIDRKKKEQDATPSEQSPPPK